MPPARPHHKRIRLERDRYADLGSVCALTTATAYRRPLFAERALARAACRVLVRHAQRRQVPLYGYCLMPDHLHLVVGPSPECDIARFVGQTKNLIQRAVWASDVASLIWQRSFWDRFIRSEEQVERVVEYVLNNPVRAGLAASWRDYPFSGSEMFSL
jgi:REP element-mobilizing transposase RayT